MRSAAGRGTRGQGRTRNTWTVLIPMKVRSQMASSRNPWDERENVKTQRWPRKNYLAGNLRPCPVTTQAHLTMNLIGPWGPGCQRTISSRLTLLFLVLTEIVKKPSPWLGLMATKVIVRAVSDNSFSWWVELIEWEKVTLCYCSSHSNNPLNIRMSYLGPSY